MGLRTLTTIWFWRPEAYTLSLCLYIAALQVIVGFVLVGADLGQPWLRIYPEE
jgi:hypothetical protein